MRAYTSEDQTVWAKLLFLAQFVYNNSCNHITQMSSNQLLHRFDCEIHIDVVNNVIEKKIPVVKNHIEKLHKLYQKLHLQLVKAQEQMTTYYNICHVLKQFKIENLIKLFIKNFKLKCWKLNSHWIDSFRMLEWIDEQTYRLALSTKYVCLHSVFSIQLLEDYHHCHDNAELMIMSDFEDFQNKWNMKKVRNKQQIKNIIHYLIKWADWFSEYNFYKLMSHLADTFKAVADYE